MRFQNDENGRNILRAVVNKYYSSNSDRECINFLGSEENDKSFLYEHFFVDRKHVLRCSIGTDRNLLLTGVALGIGPHYFSPGEFWGFENWERFKSDASADSVWHNLTLMDEFWGLKALVKIPYWPGF